MIPGTEIHRLCINVEDRGRQKQIRSWRFGLRLFCLAIDLDKSFRPSRSWTAVILEAFVPEGVGSISWSTRGRLTHWWSINSACTMRGDKDSDVCWQTSLGNHSRSAALTYRCRTDRRQSDTSVSERHFEGTYRQKAQISGGGGCKRKNAHNKLANVGTRRCWKTEALSSAVAPGRKWAMETQ